MTVTSLEGSTSNLETATLSDDLRYIVIGAALLFVLLVCCIALCCCCLRRKRSKEVGSKKRAQVEGGAVKSDPLRLKLSPEQASVPYEPASRAALHGGEKDAWNAPVGLSWFTEHEPAPDQPAERLPKEKQQPRLAEPSALSVSDHKAAETTEITLSLERTVLDVSPTVLTARRTTEEERNSLASVDERTSSMSLAKSKGPGRFAQLNAATSECRRSARLSASNGSRVSHGLKHTKLDKGFFANCMSMVSDRVSVRGSYADDDDVQFVRTSVVRSSGRGRTSSLDSDGGEAPDDARPYQRAWLQRQMSSQARSERSFKSTRLDSGFFDVEPAGDAAQNRNRSSSSDSVDEAVLKSQLRNMGSSRDGSRAGSLKSTRLDSGFFDVEPQNRNRASSDDSQDEAGLLKSQLRNMGSSRDGSHAGSLKSTRLDSGFFDGDADDLDTPRGACRVSISELAPPPQCAPSTEGQTHAQPPPALAKSDSRSSRACLESYGPLGSKGLRSARLDGSFFSESSSPAAAPTCFEDDEISSAALPGAAAMTRGQSAPSLCINPGGPLATRRKSRASVEFMCTSPGAPKIGSLAIFSDMDGPSSLSRKSSSGSTSSISRKYSGGSTSSVDEKGGRKRSKVTFGRKSEFGAAIGIETSVMSSPQQRPSLFKRQVSAPSLTRQNSSAEGIGSADSTNGSALRLQRKSSARELYSGGTMPDGTSTPRDNGSEGLLQRQQELLSTRL